MPDFYEVIIFLMFPQKCQFRLKIKALKFLGIHAINDAIILKSILIYPFLVKAIIRDGADRTDINRIVDTVRNSIVDDIINKIFGLKTHIYE